MTHNRIPMWADPFSLLCTKCIGWARLCILAATGASWVRWFLFHLFYIWSGIPCVLCRTSNASFNWLVAFVFQIAWFYPFDDKWHLCISGLDWGPEGRDYEFSHVDCQFQMLACLVKICTENLLSVYLHIDQWTLLFQFNIRFISLCCIAFFEFIPALF